MYWPIGVLKEKQSFKAIDETTILAIFNETRQKLKERWWNP